MATQYEDSDDHARESAGGGMIITHRGHVYTVVAVWSFSTVLQELSTGAVLIIATSKAA